VVIRRAVAMMLALLCASAITDPSVARAAVITGASLENQGKALELHFTVSGPGLGWHLRVHGQQLWIDLNHVRMQVPQRPFLGREVAPVSTVRVVDGGGGTARIVIEVAGRADYAIGRLPHELVLRVAPAGAVANLAVPILTRMEHRRFSSRPAPPKSTTPATPADASRPQLSPGELASAEPSSRTPVVPRSHGATDGRRPGSTALPPAARRQLVVIDAGHGGHDPGTEAAGDVAEKDIALQIAARVRNALMASGVNARLTRDSDTFLTLAERTQMANRDRADLFVSIHLNSSPDSSTAGIETYYLNNTTDRATIRLARMENGVAGGYGAPGEPNLNYILTDMRQQYKANESASLARMIEAETVADVDASVGLRLNELGAKKGPFYVLVGALMPSVLVECGFLSNPAEARLLQLPRYQQGLADGIADAVVHYFNGDAAVGNL
jgi:N-acetylmuramoyl-L-alanine amidase